MESRMRRTCLVLLAAVVGCAAPVQGRAPRAADVISAEVTPVVLPTKPCRAAIAAPKWFHDGIGYEIFVRSFADSDGDGVGDLKGVLAHLDYLNDGKPGQGDDLEVDVLWLMPIQPSPSQHGYDVTDYRTVNKDYGTDADLDALLQAAHARGMKVVLDLVVNHVSAKHPWFIGSAKGTDHADWFVWRDQDPGWKQPWGGGKTWHHMGSRWYYGVFSAAMPDLDFTLPAVRQEIIDIGAYWLGRGVDGFRLDAVRYLIENAPAAGQQDTPETIVYWQQFAAAMAKAGHEPLLVGEAWASNAIAAKYHTSPGLGMTFDFDVAGAIIDTVQAGDAAKLQQIVCAEDVQFAAGAARGTFLTNHDMVRVGTQLLQAEGKTADLRLAAMLLFSLPGTPWLYYGEEIGMTNGQGSDDVAKRLPMQWNASSGAGFTTGTPWQPPNDDAATVNVATEAPCAT
jgi:glycosidase